MGTSMAAVRNILFIMCDQLRADHLGCYGNRRIRTPAIDQLAARGVAFDRFYVASPVCQPNRATLMTARPPSLNAGAAPADGPPVWFGDIPGAAIR